MMRMFWDSDEEMQAWSHQQEKNKLEEIVDAVLDGNFSEAVEMSEKWREKESNVITRADLINKRR